MNVKQLIENIAHDARDNYLEAITEGGPLLEKNGVTTPLRIAHFFAQALHETGGFVISRESLNYSAPRLITIFGVNHHSAAITEDEAVRLAHDEEAIAERVYGLGNPHMAGVLGNTQAGDGFLYRGNGVLQMTGRGAHRKIGQACGVDFEGNPGLATLAPHALKPALQEWCDNGLNAFADKDDIRTITLRVNGGLNGFEERQAWLDKLKRGMRANGDLSDQAEAAPDEDTMTLQESLNTLGANPKIDVDGSLGPVTRAALRAFQAAAGLTADGIPGPVTSAAIQLRLSKLR